MVFFGFALIGIQIVALLILLVLGVRSPSAAIGVAGFMFLVAITSDHGFGSRGQVHMPPNSWTDADIAEQVGILLVYKIPPGCQQGSTDSSIDAASHGGQLRS